MKKIIALSLFVVVCSLFVAPIMVNAIDANTFGGDLVTQVGKQATGGQTTVSLTTIIGNIIKVVVSLLGLIAVVLIIIGGFQWMTSGGEEEKITKAKQLMINGIIGLVIIVLAYAIATFIIDKLVTVSTTSQS